MNLTYLMKFVTICSLLFSTAFYAYTINPTDDLYFYVGTYTSGGGKGIYLYKMSPESGKIEFVNVTEGVIDPSFLAINEITGSLYAVNEIADYEGQNSGSISAFRINNDNKDLSFINRKSSNGAHPCYISVDAKKNLLLTANYSGGSISINPIDDSGAILDAVDIVQHVGSSINITRQSKPHTHFINLDNEMKYIYAVDLGIDKIFTYTINKESKKVILNNETEVEKGAGPRHLAIHPNGKLAFVINELNSTIISFNIDKKNGSLTKIASYSTLHTDFKGTSYCADIHVHPNGKFLYGSNRGDNSLVIFEIDEEKGTLKNKGFESTQGNWPRNFTIDPTGNFLLVANQKSNDITIFRINNNNGLLEYTGISETVPSPVCLLFYGI